MFAQSENIVVNRLPWDFLEPITFCITKVLRGWNRPTLTERIITSTKADRKRTVAPNSFQKISKKMGGAFYMEGIPTNSLLCDVSWQNL